MQAYIGQSHICHMTRCLFSPEDSNPFLCCVGECRSLGMTSPFSQREWFLGDRHYCLKSDSLGLSMYLIFLCSSFMENCPLYLVVQLFVLEYMQRIGDTPRDQAKERHRICQSPGEFCILKSIGRPKDIFESISRE